MSTETPVAPPDDDGRAAGADPARPAGPGEAPAADPGDRIAEVARSEEFAHLRRSLQRFVFPMAAAFLIWYGLYVLLSAYARDFMTTKVAGHVNVALVFGLLQFVSTFLIAWLYARLADRRFDPQAERLRLRLEGQATAPAGGGRVAP